MFGLEDIIKMMQSGGMPPQTSTMHGMLPEAPEMPGAGGGMQQPPGMPQPQSQMPNLQMPRTPPIHPPMPQHMMDAQDGPGSDYMAPPPNPAGPGQFKMPGGPPPMNEQYGPPKPKDLGGTPPVTGVEPPANNSPFAALNGPNMEGAAKAGMQAMNKPKQQTGMIPGTKPDASGQAAMSAAGAKALNSPFAPITPASGNGQIFGGVGGAQDPRKRRA